MGLGGLEPPTSRLSSARSNQLSYKPLAALSKSTPIRDKASQARLRVAARAAPRGAPAPIGREAARERRLIIREERETKAADAALGMRDGKFD